MANSKGTPESLGVTPLAEGEHSRPVRVRAPTWVFDALAQRSPADIGKLLQTALRDLDEPALVEPTMPPLPTLPTALRGPSTSLTRPAGLSATLLSMVESINVGGVAEYDYQERKWGLSVRGGVYWVYKRDLDRLVKAGLIQEMNGRYLAK